MKKILLISESVIYADSNGEIFARGGGEISVHKFAKIYHALGFDVTVLGMNENGLHKKDNLIEDIKYIYFDAKSRKSFFDVFNFLKFSLNYSKSFNYVFLNQFMPHFLLPFLKVEHKLVLIHDLYIDFKNCKLAHGYIYGFLGFISEKLMVLLDKIFADYIVVVSESTKQKFGQHSRAVVVPNYVDTNIKTRDKDNYILFVGRFVDYKRPNDVLYVLRYLHERGYKLNAKFIVPRFDNKVMNSFKNLILCLGLESNVEVVLEPVSNIELEHIYSKALMLVHPSVFEGQGLVVYESLAFGTPVLAYDLDVYSKQEGLFTVPVLDIQEMGKMAVFALEKGQGPVLGSRNYELSFEFVKSKMANLLGQKL